MRRRIHVSYEEEDTCVCLTSAYSVESLDLAHMRRRIHVSYEEEDTCVCLTSAYSVESLDLAPV
jgi:hypothetical protein